MRKEKIKKLKNYLLKRLTEVVNAIPDDLILDTEKKFIEIRINLKDKKEKEMDFSPKHLDNGTSFPGYDTTSSPNIDTTSFYPVCLINAWNNLSIFYPTWINNNLSVFYPTWLSINFLK